MLPLLFRFSDTVLTNFVTKLESILISQRIHERPFPIASRNKYILREKTYKELCEPSEARIFSNLCLEPNRSAKVRQSSRVSNSQCSRGSEKTQKERYEAAEGSGKKTTQVDIPKLLSQETKKGTFTKGTLPKRLGDPQTDTRSSQCSRRREKTQKRVSGGPSGGTLGAPKFTKPASSCLHTTVYVYKNT